MFIFIFERVFFSSRLSPLILFGESSQFTRRALAFIFILRKKRKADAQLIPDDVGSAQQGGREAQIERDEKLAATVSRKAKPGTGTFPLLSALAHSKYPASDPTHYNRASIYIGVKAK
ncbi:hypothetical protein B0H14DRAFT_2593718 [Mycena olivaceomarginata]|nr:hypothetical protein B0H14DRAFT_2593718 [Mycena olivaceomarginata]